MPPQDLQCRYGCETVDAHRIGCVGKRYWEPDNEFVDSIPSKGIQSYDEGVNPEKIP